jgi:hypothetical protein
VTEHLHVADLDGVRTITTDRPEVKNALTCVARPARGGRSHDELMAVHHQTRT